jgi:type I restriction enzyme S subunit
MREVGPKGGVRRFKPYPTYKASGTNWLGNIPEHWGVAPLFAFFRELRRLNAEGREMNVLSLSYGRIVRRDVADDHGLLPASFATYQVVGKENLVLRLTDLQNDKRSLRVGFVEEAGIITSAYVALDVFGRILPKFGFYLLHSYDVTKVFYSLGAGVRQTMNYEDLKWLPILVPENREQQSITTFLDRETSRIDALIAKKERLIELLQEKRTALITRAVTKGLDPNVPMKDSGVEWLGRIPGHWKAKRIRDLADSLQTGPFGTQLHAGEYVSGGIPVINPANLRDGKLEPDLNCSIDDAAVARLNHHRLLVGDILFARRGELGRCGLVMHEEAGWVCGTGCLRLRPRFDLVEPRFLLHFLSTSGVRDWLQLQSVGSTMDNLNTSIIGRIPVALPSPEEQRAIADLLDRESLRTDALVIKVHQAVGCLKELRTALISAAVTGKIDVRGEAASHRSLGAED